MIVKTQEDENGDLLVTLPDEIIEDLKLKEGDEAHFHAQEDNSILITFTRYEKVEIDLEDKVLFELMLLAHERDITLNQLVNDILREYVQNNER